MLIEVHKAVCCCSDNSEISEIKIIPSFSIILRAEQEGERLRYWYSTIEWLEWCVNIRNPWYERKRK